MSKQHQQHPIMIYSQNKNMIILLWYIKYECSGQWAQVYKNCSHISKF